MTYRGVVYPSQCDHMGHMNVMWYVQKFDEATWQLLAAVGLLGKRMRDEASGWPRSNSTSIPSRAASRRYRDDPIARVGGEGQGDSVRPRDDRRPVPAPSPPSRRSSACTSTRSPGGRDRLPPDVRERALAMRDEHAAGGQPAATIG